MLSIVVCNYAEFDVSVFKTLDDLMPADLDRVGGKAFNCARLKQAGFPVPDGLVIPTDATDVELHDLGRHSWFDTQPQDTLFAVRSSGLGEDSASHSFAGIHETHLNVARNRTEEAVLACRQSAQSAQARAYREARHLGGEEARIGVLVQRMVPAVTSGVAFTVNPVTGANELVINSVQGLGEALVSGRVTPDEAVLPKTDPSPLARLLVAIEQHYGSPQDVEWCHDGQQYWVVQSRPITTAVTPKQRSAIRRAPSASRDTEWTRANLAEVLPDQLSPQALNLYVDMLDQGERKYFGRLMAPESELGPIVKAFHGRMYFNLSQMRYATAIVGAAFADTLRSMGHADEIRPDDEIPRRAPLRLVLRAVPDFVRLIANDIRAGRIFREHQAKTARALARLAAADPRTLSDREIWATFDWWLSLVPDTLTAVFVMSSVQFREDSLRRVCRAVGFSYDRLVYPQLAAGERSVSTQQAFDLVALADVARQDPAAIAYLRNNDGAFADFRSALAGTTFLEHLDRFLGRYGHRGRYESDWALPRLYEDPAPILFVVRSQLEVPAPDPRAVEARQNAEAAAAWREFGARLTPWQKVTLLPRIRAIIRRLKQQYVWREQVRSDLTRVLASIRRWHLVLAKRFVARGWVDRRDDYFLLHLDEVRRACEDPREGETLRAIVAGRGAQLAAERHLAMPLFMRESELPAFIREQTRNRGVRLQPDRAGPTSDLTGLCVSPGSAEAEVVVMRDPGEFAAMKRGAILVAPAADPSWTPLFTLASGVIVEVGGMLSHASTIAREYGLPALANVKDATRVLRTGERVRLDASAGIVRRLD